MAETTFHVAMYPWFALGHITSFLHMANKLAKRGHKISFFLPAKTLSKVKAFNSHPDLITFILITVPHVKGLPLGAETTNDVPFPLHHLIMTAMDLTEADIEASLRKLKPQFVFFDFTCWLAALTRKLGIKSVHYCAISSATIGFLLSPSRKILEGGFNELDLLEPPEGFPSSRIKLHAHEARGSAAGAAKEFGSGISFVERQMKSLIDCDAIGFKTCKEIEGPYCEYIRSQFKKPVLYAGPVVPEPPKTTLEEQWEKLLSKFGAGTVIFCAFGSECVLKKDQFLELVLGLELTGLPFLAALKPPMGAEAIESALPEGFEKRVQGRGFVHGGWVPQQFILRHTSLGCFVTHCGSGSLAEAMVNDCQLVLLPHVGDQIINARLMARELRIGVEVEKGEENGLFTKDDVYRAVMTVMDDGNELGKETRANHAKWKEFLLAPGLENSYMNDFIMKLHALL
ncbi:Anthocyanidin 3-O-glucoside 2''-O-glucosyltransferase [Hibiscus syriacus]|uniref:Glycosyltransferase n=1 Tax=Hibiscus syriacus TaxID=106335 RepID=A0A6A2ZE18_HIBSY|nr:cyanidin 3-O-galactoside 2''-O-xylosyltransferase FGGT1-like [Hibiscus syriacus]KAE8689846.1 Anthocyanidin 3-O-glucoside 2''-O-glucosyltransferase [Hibiscus syriacus]